ncbi:hypothetical protein ACO229_16825 [Promicromonospora sp. MS192]|uniref:hypothetical protein n=1 Tax=Promicromonospora sp. MS192 TaxID=3412684 RepID=UPI003C2B826E
MTLTAETAGTLELWAPYFAAGIALIIGILAPLLSARIARKTAERTLQAQRELANADRLWHKRAETYESLLRWAGEIRATMFEADAPPPEAVATWREHTTIELPNELQVRLAAYASGAVYDAARFFTRSLEALASSLLADLESGADSEPTYPAASDFHNAIANQMTSLISDELHGVAVPDHGRATGSINLPL